jgi:hypothetical protein
MSSGYELRQKMAIRQFVCRLQASLAGRLYNASNEHKAFLSSGGKCPNCQYQLNSIWWGLKDVVLFSADDKQIARWKLWKANIFSIAYLRCLECGQEWRLRNTISGRVINSKVRIIEFIETTRTQEDIGDESRVIDNSLSPAPITRKFTITREWNRSYIIELERSETDTGEISLGVSDAVSTKATAEEALREQYSLSEARKETASEEVEIVVPAHTKLSLIFQWKRIWQNGVIKLADTNANQFNVPYRIAVGITFDQFQYDGVTMDARI